MQTSFTKKLKPQKPFTEDDVEFIFSKLGFYTVASIAKRLKRSRDSVVGVLKKHQKLSFVERFKNGITPRALSVEWQVSHTNITYWMAKFNLPLILPDKHQKIGMAGQKPVTIINERELYDVWLPKGYALIKEINPVNKEKNRLVNEMRQYFITNWVPSNALSEALFITQNHIAEKITAGKILPPVFKYRNKSYLNRKDLYDWVKQNYGTKASWAIANYEWKEVD
jgi:hypothetical protein